MSMAVCVLAELAHLQLSAFQIRLHTLQPMLDKYALLMCRRRVCAVDEEIQFIQITLSQVARSAWIRVLNRDGDDAALLVLDDGGVA